MNQKPEVRSQKSEFRSLMLAFKNAFFLFSVFCFLFSAIGCDAFVRKFTRKPKKEMLPQEEMVLVPQEYKAPEVTKEDQYRQYFLFWKSWQSELIESLMQNTSQKKQIDCARQALDNLINLKGLLSPDAQKKLDVYIIQLQELGDLITKDSYGNNATSSLRSAERIKRNILQGFPYNKVKGFLRLP